MSIQTVYSKDYILIISFFLFVNKYFLVVHEEKDIF